MKIRFAMMTNKVGSRCTTDVDVDDEEWTELTESERHDYAWEMFQDFVMNQLGEWSWEETEG